MRALPGVDVRIVADRSSGPGRRDDRDPARARRGRRGAARPCSCCRRRGDDAPAPTGDPVPYVGTQLSLSALDAALRIARIEDATLVPAYLAPVPMSMPLSAPIRALWPGVRASGGDRASRGRGGHPGRRPHRPRPHRPPRAAAACSRPSATTASSSPPPRPDTDGLSAADVAWLLEHAPGEVVVRPARRRGRARGLIPG